MFSVSTMVWADGIVGIELTHDQCEATIQFRDMVSLDELNKAANVHTCDSRKPQGD